MDLPLLQGPRKAPKDTCNLAIEVLHLPLAAGVNSHSAYGYCSEQAQSQGDIQELGCHFHH